MDIIQFFKNNAQEHPNGMPKVDLSKQFGYMG